MRACFSVFHGPRNGRPFEGTDEQLLEQIQRARVDFFWNETSPKTGQLKDRAFPNGNDLHTLVEHRRDWFWPDQRLDLGRRGDRKSPEILRRVRNTLRFLTNDLHNQHGFFFHFIRMETGERWEKCELSSIPILLCGVLTRDNILPTRKLRILRHVLVVWQGRVRDHFPLCRF